MPVRLTAVALAITLPAAAHAQAAPVVLTPELFALPRALVVDADDSDDDGTTDSDQPAEVPATDLAEVIVPAGAQEVVVHTLGALRVLRAGVPQALPLRLTADALPAPLQLQARRPSAGGHPLALLVTRDGQLQRIAVHAVALDLLSSRNTRLRAASDALSVSQRVTSDPSLPRGAGYDLISPDPRNVRIQVLDAAAQGKHVAVKLESIAEEGRVRDTLSLILTRHEADTPFRSRFVRLVGDDVDASARGVAGQVLRVGLRDLVRVVYETPSGTVAQGLRVGRPGDEDGPLTARRARVRVTVLRAVPSGPPVIGEDELSALRIVQEELANANEIWLQCNLTFGSAAEIAIEIVDPPSSGLIAVSNDDGLPARGGVIQLVIDKRPLPPIVIPTGATPLDTALRIADALRVVGFDAQVTANPKTVFGADRSADVIVRRRNGELAAIAPMPGVALTTDPQQRIVLGAVDLADGLEEFNNMTASAGTLEERTLIKTLSDDDPSTIDLFIVNRFTHGTRQGEAFIDASAGSISNTVVLDRTGLRQRQTAWTMAHELGHVLLNQPLHPDNVGPDRPMLLMDSDNNRGTVNGPKRLTDDECARVRHASEQRAHPPLLQPYAPRSSRAAPMTTASKQ